MATTRIKAPSKPDLARCRTAYMADVARGSSHISSTLSAATRDSAITEVTTAFATAYGRHDLLIFVELLAGALEERQDHAAAAVLRERFAVRPAARQQKVAVAA